MNNGLPSNNVYYCTQDNKGYYWFATDKGIARYNGYEFKIYTTNDGLSDNEVFDVFQDSKGRTWFATYNGELSYYYQGVFYNRNNSDVIKKISRTNFGLKMMEDGDGNLYFISQENLVIIDRYDKIREKLCEKFKSNTTLILNGKKEVCLLSYDTSLVYISNLTNGKILSFSNAGKQFMPRVNTKADLYNDYFVYQSENRLILKDIRKSDARLLRRFDQNIQIVKFIDGVLWVGTQAGVFQVDINTGEILKSRFIGNSVSSILKDNEGHLWMTTLDNGAYLVLNEKVELLNSQSGLSFDYSSFLGLSSKQDIIIGSDEYKYAVVTNSGLMNLKLPLNTGKGLLKQVRYANNGVNYLITSVYVTRLNDNYLHNKIYNLAAKDMCFFSNDSFYLAKVTGISKESIQHFDKMIGNLDSYYSKNININHKTSYFYKESINSIFAIGNKGIKILRSPNFEDYETSDKFKNNVTEVLKGKYTTLFMASSINGVQIMYKNKPYFIDNKSGLPSNVVTCMTIDLDSCIWIGTTKGVSKITYSVVDNYLKFTTTNYSTLDGLVDNSINDILFANGKIYAATNYGVCVFSESDLITKSSNPTINLETLSFNNSVVVIGSDTSFNVDYNQSNIRINYCGISSGALSNIKYKYRMKGLDDTWNVTSSLELQYPSLPPGKYYFEIVALNPDGKESQVKRATIIINPAFYQTLWFQVLVVLVLVILFFIIVFSRVKTLKNRHELEQNLLLSENKRLELEKQDINIKIRLIELEQKALRLHMNPHFVFNAINAINGFYASGDSETGKKYITKFSQLLRMILDFSAQRFVTLDKEIEVLNHYFLLNQLRFKDKFDYSIKVSDEINEDVVAVPPLIIQPFVENSLIHGIAPLKNKGIIEVNISKEGKYLCIEVTDNGIGREKSAKINEGRIHNSTGIKITAERIMSNYDMLSGEENLQIIDLKDERGNSLGTKVKFKLNWIELF